MRKTFATAAVACGLALLAVDAVAGTGIDPQDFSQIERGRYLTIVGDCAACHTLPGSGHEFAGGRPLETPLGELVSPNITPDPETGIGAWTDDEFVNSLTKGTGRNGTHLYPAMPYTYMTKTTRDDALAIRAYLNTVPAVRNAVRINQLPFPFHIRSTLVEWDALYFKPGPFRPVAGKSAEWNRGAYLVEGLAHCGLCHTPKNEAGADKADRTLQGYAVQGWFAPNITNDARRGLGGWSVDDITEYLKTGHNGTSAATGPMSVVVSISTSHMTDADLRAIAVYLKDQPGQPRETEIKNKPDQGVLEMGHKIYADLCSGCHTPNGEGTPGLFPSVSGSPVVQQTDAISLMRVVLRGARSVGTDRAPTAAAMPAFGWLLSDKEVAAVVTYVRNAGPNAAPAVSEDDVAKARKDFARRSN
jgi:mono/diheme cytochrome c family protein